MTMVGERVDTLVNLDVPSRNVIHILYPLARGKSLEPLCLAAARLLQKKVHSGGVVFIATGWPDRPHITPDIAETDGPPGATALARTLHQGFQAVPIILVEDRIVDAMKRVTQAAGFRVLSPKEAIAAVSSHAPIHAASVIGFPTAVDEAKQRAKELIEEYRPAAVIVIEKGGMNEKGKIHTSRGAETTEHMAKIDYLVREATAGNIITIGIGDGGNELGMGVIHEELKKSAIPYAAKCQCGCGGGIAPVTRTDLLVTASISNWGAYGIAACLALLLKKPDIFHEAEVEREILHEAARASFIDGITGYVMPPSADGLAFPVHQAFVTLLGQVIRQGLASMTRLV